MPNEESANDTWLTEPYDYESPKRGQIRSGIVLRITDDGAFVDVGLKRDGFVPHKDIERLGDEASELKRGQEVTARIVRPRDRDGNLILSLYQARMEKDWDKADELLESGEIWRGEVTGFNRGGLLAQFNHIRAFIPASHLWSLNARRLSQEQRKEKLKEYVGQELPLKVIEVNRRRRRLILSERRARRKLRKENMEQLLDELLEGQVVKGTVTRLVDFGAFVDLGGADGLIHISELAWRRIKHPREVVQVGDEIDVYVLKLDHERKRIGLSLKRLRPSPWEMVDQVYNEGQLVYGEVTNVVDFGAFVALDVGVEGLVHVSELADPAPEDPRQVLRRGDKIVVRILRIDPYRKRIGLSLKRVTPEQKEAWLAENLPEEASRPEIAEEPVEETPAAEVDEPTEPSELEQEKEPPEGQELPAAEIEAEAAEPDVEEPKETGPEEETPAAEIETDDAESAGPEGEAEAPEDGSNGQRQKAALEKDSQAEATDKRPRETVAEPQLL
jgi:small subunit ribosomal protein S1